MKWVPIFGMFTKDADNIRDFDTDTNIAFVLYHGFILAGIVCFLGYILLKL